MNLNKAIGYNGWTVRPAQYSQKVRILLPTAVFNSPASAQSLPFRPLTPLFLRFFAGGLPLSFAILPEIKLNTISSSIQFALLRLFFHLIFATYLSDILDYA